MINRKLRSDLQTRKNRVFRAGDEATLVLELKGFFDFLNAKPMLRGLIHEINTKRPQIADKNAFEFASNIPSSETERVKHSLAVLNYYISREGLLPRFTMYLAIRIKGSTTDVTPTNAINLFRDTFFLPLYEYLDEHVEDYGVVLYLLQRFKFRTETFDRKYMYELYNSDPKKSEDILDREVRRFLFDQGIDYPLSTPLSSSGRPDIVADLHTEDPLVLEVKIFDPERGYDKSYIRKGFRQIFDYTNSYDKTVGYLLIFNASDFDLRFDLKSGTENKLELDGKAFCFVVVDIYPDPAPASKRGKLKPYTIEQDFLVSAEAAAS